jgi:hypothetical protein
MWQTKTWPLASKPAYERWIARNRGRFQIEIIFVNNGYGVEYRRLRVIG